MGGVKLWLNSFDSYVNGKKVRGRVASNADKSALSAHVSARGRDAQQQPRSGSICRLPSLTPLTPGLFFPVRPACEADPGRTLRSDVRRSYPTGVRRGSPDRGGHEEETCGGGWGGGWGLFPPFQT